MFIGEHFQRCYAKPVCDNFGGEIGDLNGYFGVQTNFLPCSVSK